MLPSPVDSAAVRIALSLVTAQRHDDEEAYSVAIRSFTDGEEAGAAMSFLAGLVAALYDESSHMRGEDPDVAWQRFAATAMEVHGG